MYYRVFPLQPPRSRSYGAALVISAPVVPLVAAVITVGVYYQHPTVDVPTVFGGTLVAVVLWLIGAALCRGLTTVQGASSVRNDELRTRLARLDVGLGLQPGIQPEDASVSDRLPRPGDLDNPDALRQALVCRDAAYEELALTDLRWVARTGYQSVWKQIHASEAALLEVQPVAEVAASVRSDSWRLQGSNIGNSRQLLATLTAAVGKLGPEASAYFSTPSGKDCASDGVQAGNGATQGAGTPAPTPTPTPTPTPPSAAEEVQARSMLSQVRTAINLYRDYHWDGLVRARNQLIVTVFVSSVVTYLLVEFAVIGMVDRLALITAAVLYLVGTIFGLLKRLYDESQVDRAVDDYGLSMTRIVTTPVLSGLSAIAGVMLYVVILSYAGATGQHAASTLVTSQIFDLSKYQLDLVIAAIFGLAPNALVNYLQQQSKQYVGDLKSSEAAETSVTTITATSN